MEKMEAATLKPIWQKPAEGTNCLFTILLVDDEKLVRMVAKRRLAALGHRLLEAENGEEALAVLRREPVDLVLSDWMMPKLDGPGLCEVIKADEHLQNIHFILMTALDKPAQIAEGLRRGADDFLPKSASDKEICGRVGAGLRARKLLLDLGECNRLLSQKQAQLDAELQSASDYVRSLLPPPGAVGSGIHLDWVFLPSSQLGGDLFQVARWDDDHTGMMILDMSGHGTGPALRAVSLSGLFKTEHIRSSFPFFDPGNILGALNLGNPMTDQGEYFTMWVGVYQRSTGILSYATAGHPGGVVVRKDGSSSVLGGRTWPIGFVPGNGYTTTSVQIAPGDRLYLFSDGIYEVMNGVSEILGHERFRKKLEQVAHCGMAEGMTQVIRESQTWQGAEAFQDDVALLGLEFTADPGEVVKGTRVIE